MVVVGAAVVVGASVVVVVERRVVVGASVVLGSSVVDSSTALSAATVVPDSDSVSVGSTVESASSSSDPPPHDVRASAHAPTAAAIHRCIRRLNLPRPPAERVPRWRNTPCPPLVLVTAVAVGYAISRTQPPEPTPYAPLRPPPA